MGWQNKKQLAFVDYSERYLKQHIFVKLRALLFSLQLKKSLDAGSIFQI